MGWQISLSQVDRLHAYFQATEAAQDIERGCMPTREFELGSIWMLGRSQYNYVAGVIHPVQKCYNKSFICEIVIVDLLRLWDHASN